MAAATVNVASGADSLVKENVARGAGSLYVEFRNTGPNTVYVDAGDSPASGAAIVTDGTPVPINDSFGWSLARGEKIVARCAAAETAVLKVISDDED